MLLINLVDSVVWSLGIILGEVSLLVVVEVVAVFYILIKLLLGRRVIGVGYCLPAASFTATTSAVARLFTATSLFNTGRGGARRVLASLAASMGLSVGALVGVFDLLCQSGDYIKVHLIIKELGGESLCKGWR